MCLSPEEDKGAPSSPPSSPPSFCTSQKDNSSNPTNFLLPSLWNNEQGILPCLVSQLPVTGDHKLREALQLTHEGCTMKLSPRALGYLASRYRSVLAKCRLLNTLGPLAMTCLLLAGGPGMAQASLQNPSAGVHDGLPQDYCTTLKVISSDGFRKAHEDSLSLTLEDSFPAQTAAVAGGGLARITNTGVAEIAVSESSVTVSFQDGILAGVLGGGIAEADQTAAGTAHMTIESSRATVNDGFIARIACGLVTGTVEYLEASVVGGGLAYGSQSSIRVGTTFVEINGGTVQDNTVAGSAALHGGTALVEGDTFLDLYDGETATLIGGNLLRNGTFENDATVTGSTNITMHGGTVRHNIFGGSYR